jgi:hypothetical protein
MFGDLPSRGWRLWIAWAAIVGIGVFGVLLFLALHR